MTKQEIIQADIGAPPGEYSQSWMLRNMVAINLALKNIGGRQSMGWGGTYDPDLCYNKGDVVYDDGWLMVANKDTCDRPAPQTSGAPTWDLPDSPGFSEADYVGLVRSAHEYTLTQPGWVVAIDVWAQDITSDYRIIVATSGAAQVIETASLNEAAWTTVALAPAPAAAGAVFTVNLDALNSSSTTPVVGYEWEYAGTSNAGTPATGAWNRRTQQNVIRVSKTDAGSTDRASDLLSLVAGSTVKFYQTDTPDKSLTYVVQINPVDSGTFITIAVTHTATGALGEPEEGADTTIDASIPIAQATKFVVIIDHWPSNMPTWGTVVGKLDADGVPQGGAEDYALGVRTLFQPAFVSEDWDMLARTDSSGGGQSASGLGAASNLQAAVEALPVVDEAPVKAGELREVLLRLIEAIVRLSRR